MSDGLFKPTPANKSPMQAPDTASKRATTTQELMQEKGLPGELYPVGPGETQQPAEPEVDQDGYREANEEEQAVYEQFVHHGLGFIMNETPRLVQQMNNEQLPVYQNVGKLALQITEMVKGLAESGGQEVEDDLLMAAGEEFVEHLMELGSKAQIWPFKEDSQEYDDAMAMSLMYGAELAAREQIEKGDEQYREAYSNRFATQIAREVDQGRGPPQEFFDNLRFAQKEIPRRQIHGVE